MVTATLAPGFVLGMFRDVQKPRHYYTGRCVFSLGYCGDWPLCEDGIKEKENKWQPLRPQTPQLLHHPRCQWLYCFLPTF